MRSFRATWFFLFIVAAVVAYAIYDYRQMGSRQSEETARKHIFPGLRSADLSYLSLQGPQHFILEKRNGQWFVNEPFSDLADQALVESYLNQILNQEVIRIEPDGKLKMENLPRLSLITLRQGDKTFEINVTSERTFNDGYYLSSSAEGLPMAGSSGWTAIVNKLASDLRNKDLYLISSNITEIELQEKAKHFTLISEKDEWKVKENLEFEVDHQAVRDWMLQITTLRAEDVLSGDAPRRAPDLNLSVKTKEGSSWRAELWRNPKQDALVRIDGGPLVYVLQSAKASFMNRELDQLQAKKVEPPNDEGEKPEEMEASND